MVELTRRPIELADEVVRGKYAYPRKVSALVTTASINPGEYALVKEDNEANSAILMKQGFNGKNHLDSHIAVLESGLAVPKSGVFLRHLLNVSQALAGNGVLYDANGELIEGERLNGYANLVNHNCWAWLNESFDKSKDENAYLGLDVITVTGLENGKPVFNREPLQPCLSGDCYAELGSLNGQGFPTERASAQGYKPGETIYFWYPRANSASRFVADPDGAYFYCDRGSS